MFEAHLTVFACSRALDNAGSSIAISRAMMPITTSSSTSVNPDRTERRTCRIANSCTGESALPDLPNDMGHTSRRVYGEVGTQVARTIGQSDKTFAHFAK